MKTVFGNPKLCYGNVWAFTSRMVLHGLKNNERVIYFSSRSRREGWVKEMWDCFDTKDIKLEIVDEPYTTKHKYGVPEHKELYARTRWVWNDMDKPKRKICYQLETDHNKRHPDKLFHGNVKNLLSNLNKMGIETIPLGLPLTVKDSILTAIDCDMFLGICSGMAHVMHSVGIPIYLQDWNQLSKFHPRKKYTTFENEYHLLNKITEIYNDR